MSRLAIITFITPQGVDIDNSLPGAPVYPGNALPGAPGYPTGGPVYPGGPVDPGFGRPGYGGGHPGNALPPPGSIATLPVFPFDPTRPDAGLPADQPGIDNTLPQIRPGMKFVVKWLACSGLILVPDHDLPPTAEPK